MKMIIGILCAITGLFADPSWDRCKQQVLSFQPKLPGWCVKEKAASMMDLIYELKPAVCVEVGVFGGSSLYPTAAALQYLRKGKVYAIDPWTNRDCIEGYAEGNANRGWWGMLDLETVYSDFVRMIHKMELDPYCVTMRMRGDEALAQFGDSSIDILHIDGNHTEEIALKDAKMYLPKVKIGGYIWFDDANWPTTKRAVEFLHEYCEKNEARSTDAYILFKVRQHQK